jgi:hypothetical protein
VELAVRIARVILGLFFGALGDTRGDQRRPQRVLGLGVERP